MIGDWWINNLANALLYEVYGECWYLSKGAIKWQKHLLFSFAIETNITLEVRHIEINSSFSDSFFLPTREEKAW